MKDIYLVTGNPGKLKELQMLFPAEFRLHAHDLDLHEIQSMDSEEIVRDKLQRAFAELKKPVIVEDVAAELACLNGLPGPFIKYFEKRLGKGALWKIAQHYDDHSVLIRCTMGHYDGKDFKIVHGEVRGQVVSPRGENGFGFDFVFMPEGHSRTSAEMPLEEKNQISHRGLAVRALATLLA